ncbi:hypothetical protein EVAR_95111_1 [Eumeta japonica]|uniref:Uncharacterized protein n=1 Tax=Eumeta variegata TaxID=151549 RepID=A0A4C2AAB8_EUMVA|nr:hypothetical protein EVAR_95111_1 [Eumeta japonica]
MHKVACAPDAARACDADTHARQRAASKDTGLRNFDESQLCMPLPRFKSSKFFNDRARVVDVKEMQLQSEVTMDSEQERSPLPTSSPFSIHSVKFSQRKWATSTRSGQVPEGIPNGCTRCVKDRVRYFRILVGPKQSENLEANFQLLMVGKQEGFKKRPTNKHDRVLRPPQPTATEARTWLCGYREPLV